MTPIKWIIILYLPFDKVRGKRNKYALTIVDIGSRYKDAEPMTGRSAAMTIEALRKTYKRSPLKWSKEIQCDEGSEFKGEFNKEMMARKIQIRRGIPGSHRSQCIVDNFNKLSSQRLFAYHSARQGIVRCVSPECDGELLVYVVVVAVLLAMCLHGR